MKVSEALGVKKNNRKKKILLLGILITGLLSIIIIIVTYYGQFTGNFAIKIDSDAGKKGIMLSLSQDFENATSKLEADPVLDARDMTYKDLDIDAIVQTEGIYKDEFYEFISFSYYIKNTGLEMVEVKYQLAFLDVFKGLDNSVRVLIIENDLNGDLRQTMYQKADTPDATGVLPVYEDMPSHIEMFKTNRVIVDGRINKFQPNQIRKYSIIVWLEGQDPDTTDAVLGGALRLEMKYKINNASDGS